MHLSGKIKSRPFEENNCSEGDLVDCDEHRVERKKRVNSNMFHNFELIAYDEPQAMFRVISQRRAIPSIIQFQTS